ncbi:MAG TPA: zf-HC2 domain-containing protein [Candidatus Nanopelagicaceae bacterium]
MSCGENHETPCVEVLNAVDLLIDGEIEETAQVRAIEVHLQECPPCQSELDHERRMHQILHEVLTRSCCESAPQELHDQIALQLVAMRQQPADVFTEFRMTEISIQVDDFGQIEHREIYFESTQEFRLPRDE